MSWTVSIATLPVGSTGYSHATILLRDDTGTIRGAINGGPRLADGSLADISNLSAYLSGRPLGAAVSQYSSGYSGPVAFYEVGSTEKMLVTGTASQIIARWYAGVDCVTAINAAGYGYKLLPSSDPTELWANSNSVAATVSGCIVGDNVTRAQLNLIIPDSSFPGSDRIILSRDTINEIRGFQGLAPVTGQWKNASVDQALPDGTHRINYFDADTGDVYATEYLDAQGNGSSLFQVGSRRSSFPAMR
jgi:hypothetical protein